MKFFPNDILEFTMYVMLKIFTLLQITAEDLKEVGEAIETLGVEKKKLIIEEQELHELKTELADYEEDIENFKEVKYFVIDFSLFCHDILNQKSQILQQFHNYIVI